MYRCLNKLAEEIAIVLRVGYKQHGLPRPRIVAMQTGATAADTEYWQEDQRDLS